MGRNILENGRIGDGTHMAPSQARRGTPEGGDASDTEHLRETDVDGGEFTPFPHHASESKQKGSAAQGWAPPEWLAQGLALLVVGGLAWTLYADALQGAFGFQDEAIVLGNTDTQAAPFAALLFHDYSGQKLGGPSSVYGWRPLSVLSFRLNFAVSGHQPFAFKATNICLHAMAACLVYLCSLSLMKDCIPWRSAAAPHALVHAYSLAAGLLFCAHPIHTEAVAGVSGRSDVLWVVFLLPAFLLYRAATAATLQTFDSRQHELGNTADARSSFSGVWPPLLGAAAFFCLALLSNEKAILGTLLFAANDGVWWRRHRGARADMVAARPATSAGPAAAASKLRGHGKTQAHSDAEAWRVYGPGSSGQAARDDDKIAVSQTAWYPTGTVSRTI